MTKPTVPRPRQSTAGSSAAVRPSQNTIRQTGTRSATDPSSTIRFRKYDACSRAQPAVPQRVQDSPTSAAASGTENARSTATR